VTIDKIIIKQIESKNDFIICENIQKELSQLSEVGIVPAYLMEVASQNGGLCLGAYHNGNLIGFNFSLPAYNKDDGYYLFSDTSGFFTMYQKKSFGFLLKREQLKIARERGLKKIVWTYDPLLGVNANLNIRKLGGIVKRYDIESYNDLPISTGVSIPSDRFYLEWLIKTERVRKRIEDLKIPELKLRERLYFSPANETVRILYSVFREGKKKTLLFREIINMNLDLDNKSIVIEIPYDFREMKMEVPFLASDWRLKTREIFYKYLNELNYTISDFFQLEENDEIRNFYLLKKHLDRIKHADDSESLFC
jgi:predicted GNAT superfamily acetyltransferase